MNPDDRGLCEIFDREGRIFFKISGLIFDETSRAFLGRVVFSNAPAELMALLLDLESRVQNQSFAYVDEIQRKIDAFDLNAKIGDGSIVGIRDLFISKSEEISFRRASCSS